MSNFMGRFMGGKKDSPAQSAKDRLKFVLVADRASLSPEELQNMQNEILAVIRKYARIEDSDVNLKFEQRDRESHLVADIPIKPQRAGEAGGNIHIETSITSDDSEDSNASDTNDSDDTSSDSDGGAESGD